MLKNLRKKLFENLNTRQTVAKNVFWLSAGQIGSRLFRGLVIIYAARILGAGEYGVFSYVLGLAAFFTVFADIRVSALLTRECARKPEEGQNYFATAFWIKIVLLATTAILVIFLAPSFSKIESAAVLLPFVAILTVFDGIREFAIGFFRSKEKMELEALVTTAANVAITVFGFAILYFFHTARALAITYAASAGAGTLVGILLLRKEFGGVIANFRRRLVTPIVTAAFPMALIGIMGAFMLQIDILMLGAFSTAEQIGLYSAGQKIVQLLYTLPGIVAIAFFPSISKFVGKEDKKKSGAVVERGLIATLLLAIPLALGGVILGEDIIRFLYGASYLSAVFPFRILILSVLPVFPSYLIGNYVFAHNAQKKMVPYVIAGSLINVVLNAVLIPRYGIVGAAIATVAAQLAYNGITWRLAKKINDFRVWTRLTKIIVATAAMGIVSVVLAKFDANVIVNIAVSAIAYFAALYALREQTVTETISLVLSRHDGDRKVGPAEEGREDGI